MHKISGATIKFLGIFILSLFLVSSCKETSTAQNPIPTESDISPTTNIRFATKSDDYQEKSSYTRLTTGKTEITSKVFQMEGPAWENEHVAFRNYFDTRNGMDIFGKRVKTNVLDRVGIDQNYHALQDWGMDVLKVGNSLGAGAIAMIINDTLYRIGPDSKGSFRIVSETPSESTLEFTFENWKVLDRTYKITHTISIKTGTHYYSAVIKGEGLKGDEEFVTGIVDHEVGDDVFETGDFMVLSTHGKQAMEEDNLGMAIAVDKDNFARKVKAETYKGKIDHTHLVVLNGSEVTYHFFSGWELENPEFVNAEFFTKIIKNELGAITK